MYSLWIRTGQCDFTNEARTVATLFLLRFVFLPFPAPSNHSSCFQWPWLAVRWAGRAGALCPRRPYESPRERHRTRRPPTYWICNPRRHPQTPAWKWKKRMQGPEVLFKENACCGPLKTFHALKAKSFYETGKSEKGIKAETVWRSLPVVTIKSPVHLWGAEWWCKW